ncbi:Serine/threonine-protein kinase ATM [Thalictrum thalictroides]|uniref:Serine/threonine-protein kinase ATM n=1 Tax=Thalictrum thalictroides TaxID=46969 RepID=A0A7J6VN65_THATH|nr:Serine/threonine-protein kinase ATM [Thalictrum thalictroides]
MSERKSDEEMLEQGLLPSGSSQSEEQLVDAEELCQTEEHENPTGNSDSDVGDKNVDSASEEVRLNGGADLSPKPTFDGISSADDVEGDCMTMVDGNAIEIQTEIVAGASKAEELCQTEEHENPAGNSDSKLLDEVDKNVDSAAEEVKLNGDVNLSPKPTVDGISSADDVGGDCKTIVDEGNAIDIQAEIVAGSSEAEELRQTEEHENPADNPDSTQSDEVDKNVDSAAEEAKWNGDVNISLKSTVDDISSADNVEGDGKATVDEGNTTEILAEIVAGASEAEELHQKEEHENPTGNSDSTHLDEGDKSVDSAAEEIKLNGDVNLSPKPTVDGISSADNVEGDGKATVDEGNATEIQTEIIAGASEGVLDSKEEDVNVEKSKDMDKYHVVEELKQVEESKDVKELKEVKEPKVVEESKKVEEKGKETEDLKNVEQAKNEEKTEEEICRPAVSDAEQIKEFDEGSRLVKEAGSDIDGLKPRDVCGREASYIVMPEKEGVFSVSDLVWGKVKSHPWWPGQIFDSSDASEGALKYRKKDSFLVAYFGDQTFAWNEASSLNHFRTHFSQMEKQSNSDAFRIAVDYALDEFCRRVELGMVCPCTPKEIRAKLKSQITENAGIREEARRRDGPNNSSCVMPFESSKLLQYIKALAPYPCSGVDRLELKIAQSQLLAFYRLKGYSHLPEFNVHGGLLENDVDSSGQESHSKEVIEHETPDSYNDEEGLSDTDKLKSQDRSSHKHKHGSDEVLYSSRKKRSLSNLLTGKKAPACLVSDAKNGVDERIVSNSASSSGMKCNTADPFSENSLLRSTKRKINNESPTPQSFKVGECIRRIASKLAGSSPILKSSGKVDKGDVYDGFYGSSYISEHFHGRQGNIPEEYSCPDEMLSQLCLAARDPMKGYSFLTTIVGFFSDFRNSISLENSSLGKQKTSEKKLGGGRSSFGSRRPLNVEISSNDMFDFEDLGDSYWTDRIIQSSPEKEQSHRNKRKGTELHTSSFEVEDALLLSHGEQNLDEDYVPIKEKPSRKYQKKKRKAPTVLPVDETAALDSELFSLEDYDEITGEPLSRLNENTYVHASYPMALLMSFSELDSIPSEMNLNKIFRRFGPLKESETEVVRDTSSAKVVFKKQADAEVAFSSAAKFSIFGSAQVNYQLRNT